MLIVPQLNAFSVAEGLELTLISVRFKMNSLISHLSSLQNSFTPIHLLAEVRTLVFSTDAVDSQHPTTWVAFIYPTHFQPLLGKVLQILEKFVWLRLSVLSADVFRHHLLDRPQK